MRAPIDYLLQARYQKFRRLGNFAEIAAGTESDGATF